MKKFLKSNGYPVSLTVVTHETNKNDDSEYYSEILTEDLQIITAFTHSRISELNAWLYGYYTALGYKCKGFNEFDKYIVFEYNKHASPAYVGSRFMTSYLNENSLNCHESMDVVAADVSQDEAYDIINSKRDTNVNAYLSSLPDEILAGGNAEFIRKMLSDFD